MAEHQTVQLAVIGEILPNIGVRSRAMAGSPRFTNGQEGRGASVCGSECRRI